VRKPALTRQGHVNLEPDDMSQQRIPQLSAAAHSEWDTVVENVLRGLAHALNNRAAALSAVMELAQDPGDDQDVVTSILGTELERVGDLVAVVRSMSSSQGAPDAFAPADAATEALAVLRLHADLRDRTMRIDTSRAAPLRLARWMFVRALVVLSVGAVRTGEGTTIIVAEEGDWVVVRSEADASSPSAPTPYLRELAFAMGGEPLAPADGYGFRVPTLAAIRRREGRAE
jgi:hypothetical protein